MPAAASPRQLVQTGQTLAVPDAHRLVGTSCRAHVAAAPTAGPRQAELHGGDAISVAQERAAEDQSFRVEQTDFVLRCKRYQ